MAVVKIGNVLPAALLLLSILLLAFGGLSGVEARVCESASGKFHGLCFNSKNCASVCAGEGFPSGYCHGLRKRCMCSKPCPA